MPKDFVYKDIRTLISNQKTYIEKGNKSIQQIFVVKKSITDFLSSESGKSICSFMIENEIVLKKDSVFERTGQTELFITNLYQFILFEKVWNERQYNLQNEKQLSDAIENASSASTFLKWLFTNREKQVAAENAIDLLYSETATNFNANVDRITDVVEEAKNATTTEAWTAFEHNRVEFKRVLFDLKRFGDIKGDPVNKFSELLNKADQLKRAFYELDSLISSKTGLIKKNVDRLKDHETRQILQSIPVEEISKEQSGIRIKALKDRGYTTIGKLYDTPAHDISIIRGISEDTAYNIKSIATNIYHSTFETTRLKLSYDNKNPLSSALVVSVFDYKNCRSSLSDAKEFYSKYSSDIERAKKLLSQLDGSIRWLFYDDNIKRNVNNAYHWLKKIINSEAANNILKLNESLKNPSMVGWETAWNDFNKNPIIYTNILEEIVPGVFGQDGYYGIPEELAKEIQDEAFFPDGLLCELRRYQEWGVKYTLHQKKVLLGDEMGLGKTVQSIATMVSLKNTGAKTFLVVCPASVLTNWCREIGTKSKLTVKKIHGQGRNRMLNSWIKYGGVGVTTYETTGFLNLDQNFTFDLMIVDEAHYIKNENARRSVNVRDIAKHTDRLLFLTGTALENKVDEMISLIKVLNPRIAYSLEGISTLSSASKFREKIAPVYYRRKREDVLGELPDLIENEEWCSLLPREREIYRTNVLGKKYADIRQVSWNVGDANSSSKALRLIELVEEAESEGRKVIVFSFFLNTLKMVRQALGNRCMNTINGSVPPARRQQIIDDFDKARAGTVLPAQIVSGGTGLNIQSASVVIMCEPQLKPSLENQAISRAYRMGQARNVLVFRLLCEDTIDERIMDLLNEKQQIFNAFADKSVAAEKSREIDDKTLGNLIQEEIDKINAENKNKKVLLSTVI